LEKDKKLTGLSNFEIHIYISFGGTDFQN